MDSEKLDLAKVWLDSKFADDRYRIAMCGAAILWRNGHIISQVRKSITSPLRISQFCRVCWGIAVEEGKIGSADDLAVDYYPELMDVPEGEGSQRGAMGV